MHTDFKKSVSNLLILLCLVATIATYIFPWLYDFGMHRGFLIEWDYLGVAIQFLSYQFLHWWFIHFISNAIFLYIFWNGIELYIRKRRYIILFLINTFLVGWALLYFSPENTNTVWISWFAMAILAYHMLELRKVWHPDYKWAVMFLVLNIMIGFTGNISFIGHFVWAITWATFWLISDRIGKTRFF